MAGWLDLVDTQLQAAMFDHLNQLPAVTSPLVALGVRERGARSG